MTTIRRDRAQYNRERKCQRMMKKNRGVVFGVKGGHSVL